MHIGVYEFGHPASRLPVQILKETDGEAESRASVGLGKHNGMGHAPCIYHSFQYLLNVHLVRMALYLAIALSISL